jgi:hypothetical protein
MMLSGEEIAQACRVWAQVEGSPEPSLSSLLKVVEMARGLAVTETDEPAALLYAIGRFPRVFAAGWVLLGQRLVLLQARRSGVPLPALEFHSFRSALVDIAAQRMSFAQARSWLLDRAAPTS